MLPLDEHAFRHVPQLRGKIIDPSQSRFRNMDLSEHDRQAAKHGLPLSWWRTDEEREELRRAFIDSRRSAEMWVFGYGSLMWDPGVYFDEVRIARADGYHRSFCLHATGGRGTPDNPGLMAALDEGRDCDGIAFRIPPELVDGETRFLWRREMISYGYVAADIEVATDQGPLVATTFLADKEGERYLADLDAEAAARRIAFAEGWNGTTFDYADKLAVQLELLGLTDQPFTELYERACRLRDAG